ncbi:MAG TPA: M12 family metallo-peptidase [Pyrinomonadaceae bacterium]|nr:M12 family metallo-peptidase [Pyrinomonadaceae bacterium]
MRKGEVQFFSIRLIRQSRCALALSLFLIGSVSGVSFLFDGHSSVAASSFEKLSLPTVHAAAKSAGSEDHIWKRDQSPAKQTSGLQTPTTPKFYRAVTLNAIAQRQLLRHAPMEFSKAAKQARLVMTLPMPDGTLSRFRVEESPVMQPELGALFPEIRTYRGQGLDDSTATTRFDVTPAGFHAIVVSAHGTVIIEPAAHGRPGQYFSYDQRDAPAQTNSFSCVTSGMDQALAQSQNQQISDAGSARLGVDTGATLRTYRLALAATAEYTQQYGGGTVAGALGTMVTLINNVNAIYERDLAIHLTLIANESSIIFTNTATDGYTSDDINTMLVQNQANLDRIVGAANYDVGMVLDGHVYAFQPGHFIFQGAGQYQSTCVSGQKGKGAVIFRSTEPSSVTAIYVVAHELGHMFGALHTFNGTTLDCGPSRFAQVAYEPGSGSTIMAYRGGLLPNGVYWNLCGDEEVVSSDTYFHTASIEQIVNYTSFGSGASCPTLTSTGNNPPTVNAGGDFTIPVNTPFAMTATGSDPDADTLTYCWEEYDLGAAGPPNTDNGNRPIFRSFAPVTSPVRTFPQLPDILSGTATFGESLPITTRTMNFRVTVRDNHSGGGGVDTGGMHVNVNAGSGPFIVTQPGSSTSWPTGSNQTVTWNVANTSSAPVSCSNVRIVLSIDGGSSFPFTLASAAPNTGSATITVPNLPTSTARVKVEAIDNIFFNISRPNFTITPNNTAPPTLLTEANTNRAIALDSITFVRDPFPLTTINSFSLDRRTRVTLFALGLEFLPGEDISAVTAQVEDAGHKTYPAKVEYVGKVQGFDWLTQVVIRLPDDFLNTGDVLLSVSLRGAASNKVLLRIQ